jgi:hypothetical protein
MPNNKLKVGLPREEPTQDMINSLAYLVFQLCFAQRHISSQQPPLPPKSSLARKTTSIAKINQSAPKNQHDGETLLSKDQASSIIQTAILSTLPH